MPKSPKEHDADREALDKLREILPKSWKFKSPREMDSGREVCRDVTIEIVDSDREWTGAEFSIQNKLEFRKHKNHISVPIEVDCVIYLLDKVTHPVMIHAFDAKANTSYWIWLSQWKRIAERAKWAKQKTVSIQIPYVNHLELASIEQIKETVLETHGRASIRQQVDWINKTSSSYRINLEVDDTEKTYFYKIEPKEDGLTSTIYLDKEAHEQLKSAMEKGEAVTVSGSVKIHDDILSEFAERTIGTNHRIELSPPNLSHEDRLFSFEFEDEEGQMTYKSGIVRMGYVKHGTKVITLRGTDKRNIDYKLTFNKEQNRLSLALNMNFLTANNSPKDTLHLLEQCSGKMLHMKEHEKGLYEKFFYPSIDPSNEFFRLIQALSKIEQILELPLVIPSNYTNETLDAAEAIVEGMETGRSNYLLGHFEDTIRVPASTNQPHKMVEHFNSGGVGRARIPVFSRLLFLDIELQLGELFYEFENLKIVNLKEITEHLSSSNPEEEVDYEIEFLIDKKQAYTIYSEWPKLSASI